MRANARVSDLVGGDVVSLSGVGSAMFLGRSDHPKYPGLCLVVWRLDNGSVSLDALDPRQVVGDVTTQSAGWDARLELALGTLQPGWLAAAL